MLKFQSWSGKQLLHFKYKIRYLILISGGGGGGGKQGNFGTGVQPSCSKPTPIIYLVFEKQYLFIYLTEPNVYKFIYCSLIFTSADPEGGQGSGPPGKSQVIWVSIGNTQFRSPSLENVGPLLEP